MTLQPEAVKLDELLQHLEAQRYCALQLIEKHNRMLASLLGRASNSRTSNSRASNSLLAPDPTPMPVSKTDTGEHPAVVKGNVVSLFDYSKPVASTGGQATATPAPSPHRVFEENDPEALGQWGEAVDQLLARYGADDALAINRKQMASTIFLAASRQSLFYMKSHSGVLFVVCFVGPDEEYAVALNELKQYAEGHDLQINLMAQECRVSDLKACGFSTTPMGIWQRIEPLSAFTLKGSAMRRLRYLVSKYAKSGDCRTDEYVPGTTPAVDKDICQVIDQWCELKEQIPGFVPDVKQRVMNGDFNDDHRFFLTRRDDVLDNVIVFSRDNFNNGYLMDLEFYAKDMPLGSTEFGLSEIIRTFSEEGRAIVSLGLTMGTGLFEHENASSDVQQLFESLRKADYLNGDANAQYKNKYRPTSTAMYLARPEGCGKKKLNDLMMILGTG